MTSTDLREFTARVRQDVLAERNASGYWDGYLSDSALATSVAVAALLHARRRKLEPPDVDALVTGGLAWLETHRNEDGGWGDCPESPSNISTVTLTYATLALARQEGFPVCSSLVSSEKWLQKEIGSLSPDDLAATLYSRYGKDRTFAVPILAHCAMAGILGEGKAAWRYVEPLPFELSTLPHKLYKSLDLSVVSYALPALIAIGHARHHHLPGRNWPVRLVRDYATPRALEILGEIQPSIGGYLEATPLTAFVTESLVASGLGRHPVVPKALGFLVGQARPNGSWPIDANLTTWVTTLSVNALAAGGREALPDWEEKPIQDWLLGQQWLVEHPFTHADPGGFAWTDLPGGVPDADDTPGALLALKNLRYPPTPEVKAALEWLLGLQNKDGGIPTFCRGWGKLPFDKSSPDLTIHALRAWQAWVGAFDCMERKLQNARKRALDYLRRTQLPAGYWVPLWFGNQHAPGQANPVFGTSRVLSGLAELPGDHSVIAKPALKWLLGVQNPDGSWGGDKGCPGSIEETSLALHALLSQEAAKHREAVHKALDFLLAFTSGHQYKPSPIGLYFAKLWYHERMYPKAFLLASLEKALSVSGELGE